MTIQYDLIVESFLDPQQNKTKSYYIDAKGEIHKIKSTNIKHIVKDLNIYNDIAGEFREIFGKKIKYKRDIDFVIHYVNDICKSLMIKFMIFDLKDRVLYVKSKPNSLNEIQRKTIREFCLSKNCELVFDE